MFLVTNKHVVEKSNKGNFFFILSKNGLPVLGEKIIIEEDNFSNLWYMDPNPDIDLAMMDLTPFFKKIRR